MQVVGSFPLLEEEGRPRHQKRRREATFVGADGVVGSAKSSGLKQFAVLTTPSAPPRWLRDFLLRRSHPSFSRRGKFKH